VMPPATNNRIINQLRRLFPAGRWVWKWEEYRWFNEVNGDAVTAVSVHSPIYDGDEDRFTTRYMLNWPNGKWVDGILDGRTHRG